MSRNDFPQPVEVRKTGDRWEWICRRGGYDRDITGKHPTWAEAFADGFDHSGRCNIPIRSIAAAVKEPTQ